MLQFDREKLKAVILHTCNECGPHELGAVKLHKVLYFADMVNFLDVGAPMTGATYRKRQHGPICDPLLRTLSELQRDGAINVEEVDYFGYKKKQFAAIERVEPDRLNGREIALLDEVIDFVCRGNTAKTISEFSHNLAWEIAEFGDIIPYHSAFALLPGEVSEETLLWATEEAEKLEAQGSTRDTVGSTPYRTIRARILQGV